MKYRAEIDGLRAIAVIPVILFHAGLHTFSGGFVGVDVFFVISSYLITTIILSEKDKNCFSIVNFYERRARRILPAIFFVIALSLPFAYFLLLPEDLKDFSQSLMSIALFSSNILFWQETGYWGTENELKPMLHTWSLAVEEQYYVVFPLLLAALGRFRQVLLLPLLLALIALSFVASIILTEKAPSANFFLLPTRAWELGIGAIIAYVCLYHSSNINKTIKPIIAQLFSIVGLFLIALSVFGFNESTPFPGIYALVPTLGTALIILCASPKNAVGKLLSSRVLVGIGLISYSAYLWHQPLFAFARHYSLKGLSINVYLALSMLSLVLAYLTWKYVEVPFRSRARVKRQKVFLFAVIGTSLLLLIGTAGHITFGFTTKPNESTEKFFEAKNRLAPNTGLNEECEGTFTLTSKCRTGNKPIVVLWGDSYAMHLAGAIQFPSQDIGMIQFTKSTCGPFLGIAPFNAKYSQTWAQSCITFNKKVAEWLKNNRTVKHVVMASPFEKYLDEGNSLLFENGNVVRANKQKALEAFQSTLAFIERLGIKPIIVAPPPSDGSNLGRCLVKASHRNLPLSVCDYKVEEIAKKKVQAYEFLSELETQYKVIRLDDYLCKENRCITSLNNKWLYRDSGHLSKEGSHALGKHLNFYQLLID